MLPIIIFFSSVISLCYYIGIMQVIIKKIAWLMQKTMKTSGVESLNAAGNIFIGQVLYMCNLIYKLSDPWIWLVPFNSLPGCQEDNIAWLVRTSHSPLSSFQKKFCHSLCTWCMCIKPSGLKCNISLEADKKVL